MSNRNSKVEGKQQSPAIAKLPVMRRLLIWWHKQKYCDSLLQGRMYGKFYVKYPDGQRSINMYYKTAKDYASIFGGEVKCVFNGA